MHDNSGPLVSVITPAYNSAATLRRAYESVRRQNANWQHIIVDDGSTDSTREIIASLAQDSRVAGAARPNGGSAAALNAGLRLALGSYIAFLDADDEYCPNHLEAHLALFDQRPDLDLLWGGLEVVCRSPEDAFVPDIVAGSGYIHASECAIQGTLFGRRRVFDILSFNEDRAMWYQDYDLVQRARRLFHVEKFALATYRYYRDHGASIIDRVKKTWPAAQSAAPGL